MHREASILSCLLSSISKEGLCYSTPRLVFGREIQIFGDKKFSKPSSFSAINLKWLFRTNPYVFGIPVSVLLTVLFISSNHVLQNPTRNKLLWRKKWGKVQRWSQATRICLIKPEHVFACEKTYQIGQWPSWKWRVVPLSRVHGIMLTKVVRC